jgi:DNA-binding SARP family transcriptional activator
MRRTCAVHLLGGFAVEVDGRSVPADAWRHRRGADLVKLLALAPGQRVHREQAMAALWPDLDPAAAAANLRKALHFARRALGGAHAIAAGPDLLALWPEGDLEIDFVRFEVSARRALAAGAIDRQVDELLGRELLPEDRYAEWTESPRARVADLSLDVLRKTGRWAQLLEIDHTNEQAHRALMQQCLNAGDREGAIRQFRRLREGLRVDLGVSPEAETIALFEHAVGAQTSAAGHAETAQTFIARGLLAWSRRDLAEGVRLAHDARRLAREHHLGRELGEACALLGMTSLALGSWREQFGSDFAEAVRLSAEESSYVFDAHLCLAETAMSSSDSRAVGAQARELLPVAQRVGSLHGQGLASLLIGEAELVSGDVPASQRWLRAAVDFFGKASAGAGMVLAMVHLAESEIGLGRSAEAERLLTQAQTLAERSELAPHLVTRVFAARLAAAGADRELLVVDEAERELRPAEVCGPCSIGMRAAATIAYARSGELVKANKCLADAERLAGIWHGGAWQAATWEARAWVRLAEGDRTRARALFLEAAAVFAGCSWPVDEQRCRAEALRLP